MSIILQSEPKVGQVVLQLAEGNISENDLTKWFEEVIVETGS